MLNTVDAENYKHEAEVAERNADYGKVAEFRYGKIKESERSVFEMKISFQTVWSGRYSLSLINSAVQK